MGLSVITPTPLIFSVSAWSLLMRFAVLNHARIPGVVRVWGLKGAATVVILTSFLRPLLPAIKSAVDHQK